jgi:hypothetical protein
MFDGRVEQGRLPGAGPARHDDVAATRDGGRQEVEHRLRQRLAFDQILRAQLVLAEPPDRQRGAVERERVDDRVHARAVGQARVHHRARLVDAAADGADDPLDDLQQVPIVPEHRVGRFETPVPLDVDLVRPVDEDVGHRRVAQQRLERPEAEQLVDHVTDQALALLLAERGGQRLAVEQPGDQAPDLGLGVRAVRARQPVQVDPVQQFLVDPALHGLVPRVARIDRRRRE